MLAVEAAAILKGLADRLTTELRDALAVADEDQRALIYSSGDLDVISALTAGMVALSESKDVNCDDDPLDAWKSLGHVAA